MYFVWLFSVVAVGIVGWLLLRQGRSFGRVLIGGSVVGCVSLVGWQVITTLGIGGSPQLHRSQAAVAYTLAQQFLGDTTTRKGSVILIFPPDAAAPAAALDSFYEAFARVMTRFPSIMTREHSVDVSVSSAKRGDVPADEFARALEEHQDALALVSWVGFPSGVESLPSFRDPKTRVPVYVYDPNGKTNWLSSVKTGVIRGGVIPFSDDRGTVSPPGPRTPAVVFAESYRLATPKNLSQVLAEIRD